jgi:hypothetical protein
MGQCTLHISQGHRLQSQAHSGRLRELHFVRIRRGHCRSLSRRSQRIGLPQSILQWQGQGCSPPSTGCSRFRCKGSGSGKPAFSRCSSRCLASGRGRWMHRPQHQHQDAQCRSLYQFTGVPGIARHGTILFQCCLQGSQAGGCLGRSERVSRL